MINLRKAIWPNNFFRARTLPLEKHWHVCMCVCVCVRIHACVSGKTYLHALHSDFITAVHSLVESLWQSLLQSRIEKRKLFIKVPDAKKNVIYLIKSLEKQPELTLF